MGWIVTTVGGEAAVNSELLPSRPRNRQQELKAGRNGVVVSNCTGTINMCDYSKLSNKAKMFISPKETPYMGMLLGELLLGSDDLDLNICRAHDGYQGAEGCSNAKFMTMEQELVYVNEDECVEVTPKRVVMRKLVLDTATRINLVKQAKKKDKKVEQYG